MNDCPRCGGPIPTAEHPGLYPGAVSRADDRTEICSPCGMDEALEQWAGRLTPVGDWPVSDLTFAPLVRQLHTIALGETFTDEAMTTDPITQEE